MYAGVEGSGDSTDCKETEDDLEISEAPGLISEYSSPVIYISGCLMPEEYFSLQSYL